MTITPGARKRISTFVTDMAAATEASSSSAEASAPCQLPVTVLSGFLGSGKTTLLKHILTADHGYKIAVIVNDMGEVNVDASIAGKVMQAEEKLVSMANGCICCTLREDLLVNVAELAKSGKYDYVVIESTGVSEPMPVAETFTFETDGGNPLMESARLDTLVTVVDGRNFGSDLESMDYLEDRDWAPKDEDDRNVSQLLVDQIEFANVVIINKCDLLTEEQVAKISGLVTKFNPKAKQIKTSFCKVDLSEILNTKLFSMEDAAAAPGWLQELRGEHVPETEEYGISSFVFRARRPFHPQRLDALLDSDTLSGGLAGAASSSSSSSSASATAATASEEDQTTEAAEAGDDDEEEQEGQEEVSKLPMESLPSALQAAVRGDYGRIVRSKGIAWLANKGGQMYPGDWSHAGRLISLTPEGQWLAMTPREEWPDGAEEVYGWEDTPFVGDRKTEVVIIGIGMDKAGMRAALEACLLTDEEFAAGPKVWEGIPDPIWHEINWDEYAAAMNGDDDDDEEEEEHHHHHHHHSHATKRERDDESAETGKEEAAADSEESKTA